MQKLTNEQIEAAVNWWANAIRNPKFDDGDDGSGGGMAMMMATLARKSPNEDEIEAFKVALAEELCSNENVAYLGLSCDYGPDGTLADALQKAGMDVSLPWKTNMNFRDGKVSVSHGYRAEYVDLSLKVVGT